MSATGLPDFLRRNSEINQSGTCELWNVHRDDHYSPGFWVSLAAIAKHQSKAFTDISITCPTKLSYAQAIGLPVALGGVDEYPFERKNEGRKYSPLILLENPEATDRATRDVNGCIRNMCQGFGIDRFVSDLCEVVGDLHDNVWSHGESTGFSMAQRWNKPYSDGGEQLFEFALADCGIGFLRELNRVGLNISCDRSAIEWCIQRGNSSKLVNERSPDAWEQRLPPDIAGNPMPGVGRAGQSDNHHQGLGLAKLISLVTGYNGQLWICSGNAILDVSVHGAHTFSNPEFYWQGVTLACRFDSSVIRRHPNEEAVDEVTADLMDILGARNGNHSTQSSRN